MLLLVFALNACAPAGGPPVRTRPDGNAQFAAAHGERAFWRLADLAGATKPYVVLRAASGAGTLLETGRLKMMHSVATRVLAAAGTGEEPQWLLVANPSVNAFATYQNREPVIAVTLGMVGLLKDDEAAWAALFGHELAHFRLGHHQAQRSRKEAIELGSSLAGLLLSAAGLGVGSLAADATGTLVARSFSRDDERDADSSGVAYMRAAGLDPEGAVRLQQRLMEAKQSAGMSFLSTHPSGKDRIDAIRRLLTDGDD